MKAIYLIATAIALPVTAVAGKQEREYMKTDVVPAIRKAEATFKTSCGCGLRIAVTSSIKTRNDLYEAKHIAEMVTEGAPGHCTDAESKKAVCQMKSLDIAKGPEAKFVFKDGKGTAITDGQVYPSWDMVARELDK